MWQAIIKCFRFSALAILGGGLSGTCMAADAEANAEKIARLEARLARLEARLADNEQETKEVKVLAANVGQNAGRSGSGGGAGASPGILGNTAIFDILAGSAWRNLRWTQEEQWAGIRRGVTKERVIELLGSPPRSLDSLKPRVDEVFFYETSLRDRSNALRGKVSFRDERVIGFEKPNFKRAGRVAQ